MEYYLTKDNKPIEIDKSYLIDNCKNPLFEELSVGQILYYSGTNNFGFCRVYKFDKKGYRGVEIVPFVELLHNERLRGETKLSNLYLVSYESIFESKKVIEKI